MARCVVTNITVYHLQSTTAQHLQGHQDTAERRFNAECACRPLETEQTHELKALIWHHCVTINTYANHEVLNSNFLYPSQGKNGLNADMFRMQARMIPLFAYSVEQHPKGSHGYASYEGSARFQLETPHCVLPTGCYPFAKLSHG